MLSTLRNALADTINSGNQGQARVVPYPPLKIDMPSTGFFAYIRAAEEETYLERWLTFDPAVWVRVNYEVVVLIPDDNPQRAAERLDDLIDPMTGQPGFFSAIRSSPTFGITSFAIDAQPMFEAPIRAPERVTYADGNVFFWRVICPVAIVANTTGA